MYDNLRQAEKRGGAKPVKRIPIPPLITGSPINIQI